MSMNVGSSGGDEDAVMSAINTTPLVDVMLVLLIIFLITIPVVTTSIAVSLPKERVEVRESKPENVIISVDQSGNIFWYEAKIKDVDALVEKLKKVSHLKPQPEVQVRGDLNARYEGVGKVLLACQRAVDQIQSTTQGGLAFLATVGSTSPFVGLFGTVWGIYHALTAIGISGQASIDKVAGPVGEALIMTAIGLAVAVPAVLAYNWLVRRNKVAMDTVRAFGSDLHTVLLAASARRDAAPAPAVA